MLDKKGHRIIDIDIDGFLGMAYVEFDSIDTSNRILLAVQHHGGFLKLGTQKATIGSSRKGRIAGFKQTKSFVKKKNQHLLFVFLAFCFSNTQNQKVIVKK